MDRRAALGGALTLVALAVVAAPDARADPAQLGSAPTVTPGITDPGAEVVVASPPGGGCARPEEPRLQPGDYVTVRLVDQDGGSPVTDPSLPRTNVNPTDGSWSVRFSTAAATAPGTYDVQAQCRDGSGVRGGNEPFAVYATALLNVRLQRPGRLTLSTSVPASGSSFTVESADKACVVPRGAAAVSAKVSLVDGTNHIRTQNETAVDLATGRWMVTVRVPSMDAGTASVQAECRVGGASAPYAQYDNARVEVVAAPTTTTTAPPSTSSTVATTTTVTAPGSPTSTAAPGSSAATPTAELPDSPPAVAVRAEPTYTG